MILFETGSIDYHLIFPHNCFTKLTNIIHSPSSIALFEKMVEGLGVPVEIATTEAHVPSFMVRESFLQKKTILIILLLFSGEMGVLSVDKEGG